MGNLEISHDILSAGSGFEACQQQVRRFFQRTMLISYDEVLIVEKESISGAEKDFWPRIQEGLIANKRVLGELLANLKEEGFTTLEDLRNLEKGYLSKILHTIAHLHDGFIGIDSRFYNLEEDSHGLTRDLLQKIILTPDSFWVLRVKGKIASTVEDPFNALRTFEEKAKLID